MGHLEFFDFGWRTRGNVSFLKNALSSVSISVLFESVFEHSKMKEGARDSAKCANMLEGARRCSEKCRDARTVKNARKCLL